MDAQSARAKLRAESQMVAELGRLGSPAKFPGRPGLRESAIAALEPLVEVTTSPHFAAGTNLLRTEDPRGCAMRARVLIVIFVFVLTA